MLQYTPIENQDKFCTCCDDVPSPTQPGTGDCCQDYWKTDLTHTTCELKKATAYADQKDKEFTSKSQWLDVLKGWCNDWETVDKNADTLCRNLEVFCKHLIKVGRITQKTADAINILFCMIKELYTRVDLLKEKYEDLYKCIKCLKAIELESGAIRSCLDDYGVKLIAITTTRDIIIGKVIFAIELSYELHDNIADDEYGLISVLEYWKDKLKCCADSKLSSEEVDESKPECDEKEHCDLIPIISFPIKKSKYFIELKKHRDYMETKVYELKKENYEAGEIKAGLQGRSDGLNNAINSVANSGKCK